MGRAVDVAAPRRGHRNQVWLRSFAALAALLPVVAIPALSKASVRSAARDAPDSSFTEQARLPAGTAELSGESVAISEDGSIALVGAPLTNSRAGAVLVFTHSGSSWKQTGTLTPSGEVGPGEFGESVSISANGDTAIVGAPYAGENAGAAWVFTRSGSSWKQTAALAPGAPAAGAASSDRLFGKSVALSGDGQVAVIGAPKDDVNEGTAWVFTSSGATWTQAGAALSEPSSRTEAEFGSSVAASSSGEVLLIGQQIGDAAWVFTRSGSAWVENAKLTGAKADELAYFGYSVALSAAGNVALVGGPHSELSIGAGWVFTRTASGWKQEGGKLIGTDKTATRIGGGEEPVYGDVGDSVSMSANGKTVLLGGEGYRIDNGAAWVFTWTGSTWKRSQRIEGAHETIEGLFGASVALAGNGQVALIGGPADEKSHGSVWVYVPGQSASKTPPQASKKKAGKSHQPAHGAAAHGRS